MVFQRRFTAAVTLAGLAVLSVTLAGCGGGGGGGGTPPATSPTIRGQSSRQITFPEFQNTLLAAGVVTRLEIKVIPNDLLTDPLVADEVEIQEPEETADDEEIESRIVEIVRDPVSNDVTGFKLELGGLVIGFNAETEFKDDRSSSENLTFDEFVEAVSGASPENPLPIKVERAAPTQPQAPDDPTFIAAEIKLVDQVDEPEIEINVDQDNLLVAPNPGDPGLLAILRVLGLDIEIRQGVTELEAEVEVQVPAIPGAVVEFEDRVVAVNPAAGTFTLASGTLVRVTPSTTIDPAGDLFNLSDVATDVTAGERVRAEGNATVDMGPPVVLVATDVKFEVDQ